MTLIRAFLKLYDMVSYCQCFLAIYFRLLGLPLIVSDGNEHTYLGHIGFFPVTSSNSLLPNFEFSRFNFLNRFGVRFFNVLSKTVS